MTYIYNNTSISGLFALGKALYSRTPIYGLLISRKINLSLPSKASFKLSLVYYRLGLKNGQTL